MILQKIASIILIIPLIIQCEYVSNEQDDGFKEKVILPYQTAMRLLNEEILNKLTNIQTMHSHRQFLTLIHELYCTNQDIYNNLQQAISANNELKNDSLSLQPSNETTENVVKVEDERRQTLKSLFDLNHNISQEINKNEVNNSLQQPEQNRIIELSSQFNRIQVHLNTIFESSDEVFKVVNMIVGLNTVIQPLSEIYDELVNKHVIDDDKLKISSEKAKETKRKLNWLREKLPQILSLNNQSSIISCDTNDSFVFANETEWDNTYNDTFTFESTSNETILNETSSNEVNQTKNDIISQLVLDEQFIDDKQFAERNELNNPRVKQRTSNNSVNGNEEFQEDDYTEDYNEPDLDLDI